jgi:hypothetical protein
MSGDPSAREEGFYWVELGQNPLEPLDRRDSIMQADRPPHPFPVCRKEPAEPRTQKCQDAPQGAGLNHPDEGWEN